MRNNVWTTIPPVLENGSKESYIPNEGKHRFGTKKSAAVWGGRAVNGWAVMAVIVMGGLL